MATPIPSICIISFLFSSSIVSLFLLSKGYALSGEHHHTVQISSLLSASVCSPSTKEQKKPASLKVVHKHGPCSHLNLGKSNAPTATQVLSHDQSRVNSIQSRLAFNSGKNRIKDSHATLPAKLGNSLNTGNYIVTVGLGTPKKDLFLIFDTGSDLTWTQCEPCIGSCYKQQHPIFDPSGSKTYKNISCDSAQCSELTSATGNSPQCYGTTCVYGIQYGDRSFSAGFFGAETLTLTYTDVFPNFLFGCGQNNQGLFGVAAGLLGLGRNKLSIVSQTASKYRKYFSYCLPKSSSTGYLTFGKCGSSSALKFTPLVVDSRGPSFYFIDIVAIKVGDTLLSISQSVFKTSGTIIDSGTVISRLPSTAYTALETEFRKQMAKYPRAPALSILNTCYNLSNYTTITVPIITFYFRRNIQVPLEPIQVLYAGSASQVCLAFAGNSDQLNVGIFGNIQQLTLNVVYDVAGGKLGFSSKGC